MTRKEFENYIEENKLTALFTRDKDSLYGQDIILTYCDSDKAVYTGAYGCIHDEKGYMLDSRVYGERGDERGCIYSDYFASEEKAFDELKKIVDSYKGYTIVHSYKENVNKFMKEIAGKTIEPPFSKWYEPVYDISFAKLESLIKEYFPGLSFVYDYDRFYGGQINIIAKEHIKILSVGTSDSKAVYWEFEDRKFIMFNELNGTFCDYKCDESGIYTLYYNSINLLIKYSYDGSILYSLNRGSFNDDDLLNPKFFSTFPVFDEKYSSKKYLGISNGTSTIIFERETGKIVYGVKTEWNKK
ncbi:MAG: hypothetical protein PUC37_01745 [Spirochaetales bacterium]|nr:hypothetical protein [Spirochaetales bacterium]